MSNILSVEPSPAKSIWRILPLEDAGEVRSGDNRYGDMVFRKHHASDAQPGWRVLDPDAAYVGTVKESANGGVLTVTDPVDLMKLVADMEASKRDLAKWTQHMADVVEASEFGKTPVPELELDGLWGSGANRDGWHKLTLLARELHFREAKRRGIPVWFDGKAESDKGINEMLTPDSKIRRVVTPRVTWDIDDPLCIPTSARLAQLLRQTHDLLDAASLKLATGEKTYFEGAYAKQEAFMCEVFFYAVVF